MARASAPQNVTRQAPTGALAPPARAATAPRTARKTSEVADTQATRPSPGNSNVTPSGSAAPNAKLASAASFAFGAALPLGVTLLLPGAGLVAWVSATSLVFLAVLGAVAARAGGASAPVGAWRVTFWGALALAITAGVGALVGTAV